MLGFRNERFLPYAPIGALALSLVVAGSAWADQDPSGCNANRLNLDLARDKSVIVNPDTVTYTVEVSNNPSLQGDACDITDARITFQCPDADGNPGTEFELASGVACPPDGSTCFSDNNIQCVISVTPGVTTALARAEVGELGDLSEGRLHDSAADSSFEVAKELQVEVLEPTPTPTDTPTPTPTDTPTPTPTDTPTPTPTDTPTPTPTDTPTPTPTPTPVGEEICRTPGFWGTHAGTEKKRSQNITQAVINASGGCLEICGEIIDDTDLDSADSAVEAVCVSVEGQSERQLARQLTAAALNCIVSGGGADCNGTSIAELFADCNVACVESLEETDPPTATRSISECIDEVDCFNNGGTFVDGTCFFGRCSVTGELCNADLDCGVALTCEPAPGCHERELCRRDESGDPIDPALCFEPPGPAGSSAKCSAATGNACTVIPPGEESCSTGTISSGEETCN